MRRVWIVLLTGLLLTGCVIGTKADFASLMRAVFEAGFNCARIDGARTFDDCWNKYRDIIER